MKRIPITTNVVSLDDYRKKKQTPDSFKQQFKDSLDNNKVMQNYKIQQPTEEERRERIKESIARINAMFKETNNQ